MDKIAACNKERWEELSAAGIVFGRPWLDLTADAARKRINPENVELTVWGRVVHPLGETGVRDG